MKKLTTFLYVVLCQFFFIHITQAAYDCVQDGGNTQCIAPKLTSWKYSVCPAGVDGEVIWCLVRGGSVDYNKTCHGAIPNTNKILYPKTVEYFNRYGMPQNVSLNFFDTGWGQTFTQGFCWGGSPTYMNNTLVLDFRKIIVTGGGQSNSNSFRKDRKFECLPNQWRSLKNGDTVCAAEPPRGCTIDAVGNPCSITTGNKFQVESDWVSSHNSILSFKRIYNSFPLQENSGDIHAFGATWTHHYNQRLILWKYSDEDDEDTGNGTTVKESVVDGSNLSGFVWGRLIRSDGKVIHISRNYSDTTLAGENGWFISRDENLKLVRQDNGFWRVDQLKTGIKEYYDQTGKFVKMTYPNGQFIDLSYANVQLNNTTLLTDVLVKVTDNFGKSLQFNYNPQGLIASVALPNSKYITYQYDMLNRLSSVTRPGYGTKTYHYSENSTVAPSGNPNLLTGITDEAGKRYTNYAYDTEDRGVLTEHAGNSQKYTLQHKDSHTLVTDPNGTAWTYYKVLISGTPRISTGYRIGIQQIASEYDQVGNLTKKIEKRQTTTYSYDLSRNLETSHTEAVGTAQERTINTTWHPDFPKPTQIQEVAQGQVLRTTSYTYDNHANALTKTITNPNSQENRTWSYEYNSFGQMTKQVTPNGEQTTYQYDENNGNLLSSIDSNGITTTYSLHNADGQPTKITTSTGLMTELVYDDAGRVIQQKQNIVADQLQQQQAQNQQLNVLQKLLNALAKLFGLKEPFPTTTNSISLPTLVISPQSAQQAINTYEYDPRGLLTAMTLADGERIEYSYDDAHRLTEIKDQSGNRTIYTLNGNGDITQTEVYGATGQLEAKNQQVYDNLGRLQKTLGNNQQIQTLTYNDYDQQTTERNALNQNYSYDYDALGRQSKETTPLYQSSQYEYDALDQLKKVIDAKGGTTTYQYNAFGEVIQQNSPDTGITSYQYQNGKLLEKVDANQRKHRYQYDAQGRITLQQDQYTDGTEQYENTSFAYGQTGNDQGRLVQVNNKRAETSFSYNNLGLVRQKTIKYLSTQQSTAPQLTTYYSYSLGGKLKQVGLPSGNIVNYDYDNKGQLTGIKLNSQNFINNIQHSANGIKGWTYSQVGDQAQYQYDLDGRIQKILMPNVYEKDYSYDAADRILAITDPNNSNTSSNFKHDALSRLIEQNLATKTFKYSYDANSNRLTRNQTENGVTKTENYSIQTGNNRINNITQGSNSKTYSYLPTGQIISDGVRSYTYNAQGRSESISTGTSSSFNIYDAFGQRIQKIGSDGGSQMQTLFVYDENGQLLGEYTPQGEVIREYIWLENRLVGLRSSQYPNEILRVHTDHLGTPRTISDNQNQIIWRWEGDQFGDVLPTGNLNFPLRHAGQYYDSETGIFYNYFRDYDPITGRYLESDPIGLDGGLNTYGYVGGSVLFLIDPKGLQAIKACRNCNDVKEKVRRILETNFPKYRKIKCTLKCGGLLLGGQGATNLLTGQITLNYDQLSELDSLAFTTTLAHELLHCKDGYGLSHWGASDPDRLLYNPYHGRLDDTAYNDAYIILDKVRELFKCPECTP